MVATSEAPSGPDRWNPFTGRNASQPPPLDRTTDSTVLVAASSDGRVARPARRRTRASRKTPVTLLNTDTANFRAMVQQFTGFPTGPQYQQGFHDAPPASVMTPPTVRFPRPQLFMQQPQLQFQPPAPHQQQHLQFPEANEVFHHPNHSNPTSSEMGDVFLYGLAPDQSNIDSGNFRWR
ncbi:VQ motif-containing protein 22-like [Zingiber officinale]|uniref:VQ motif-containing protein 22-like n=1 Tax=Zingiber officinale TaxID=94328 RepID=UPI001C4CBB2C|nr:VQ motif-containing protein 22-like [Zingiber officinale]